jgi:hypothetical protein
MNHHPAGPAMSQKIFSMNLDVETVSLYLLCCATADAGGAITPATLEEKWNGDAEALKKGLDRLEQRNILCRQGESGPAETAYLLTDEKNWR